MKTVMIALIVILCAYSYAQSPTPTTGDESSNNSVPTSVKYSNATDEQNYLAWKGGAPILSMRYVTNYSGVKEVKSFSGTGLVFNQQTGENTPINLIISSSEPVTSWQIPLISIFFMVVMFFWTMIFKKNSNWQLGLPLIIFIVSALTIIVFNFSWKINFKDLLSFFESLFDWKVEISDMAFNLMLSSICASSLLSIFPFLMSDAKYTENLSKIIFFGLNIVLMAILFFGFIPEARMFAFFGIGGILFGFVCLIIKNGFKIVKE